MDNSMNIDDRQAKESLEMIQQTAAKTKKALSADASPWLILWGGLWIAAFTTCHFYQHHAGYIFAVMTILGSIGSGIIAWWCTTRGPIQTDSKNSLNKKISWFWIFLFIYVAILLWLLSPIEGLKLNAVIVITVMFAYVVMGLFDESLFLIIIGLFVIAITLLAYYAFPAYYCLWLAGFGGGAFLGTGVYIRLKWR